MKTFHFKNRVNLDARLPEFVFGGGEIVANTTITALFFSRRSVLADLRGRESG